jgi:competence protein ComEC
VEGSLRVDPSVELDRWSGVLDVRSVRWDGGGASVRETVWLSGRDEPPDAVRGDRLRVSGWVRPVDDAGFASFLLRRGIVAELEVDEAERLGPAAFAPVRWAQSFRALAGRSIESSFPPRGRAADGARARRRPRLDPGLERDFRATGLSHLLVVSGENVAMVLAPIVALGAALGWSRWPRFALGMGTVAFFVVLTGAELGDARRRDGGLALIGVLLGRPRSTELDPRRALSCSCSIRRWCGRSGSSSRWRPRPAWSRSRRRSRRGCGSSVVAVARRRGDARRAGRGRHLLFYFHEVPVSTVAANVLAFRGRALLLGWRRPRSGSGPGRGAPDLNPRAGADATWRPSPTVARAPIPWITGGGALTLILGLVLAALLAWWLRAGRPPKARFGIWRRSRSVWTNAISAGPPSALTVRFFDVGQGDSALLTSPGGVRSWSTAAPIPPRSRDRARGARGQAAGPDRREPPPRRPRRRLLAVSRGSPSASARAGCRDDSRTGPRSTRPPPASTSVRHPRAGDVLQVGDVRLEILSPDRCWSGTESDTNNDAIVVRASIGETRSVRDRARGAGAAGAARRGRDRTRTSSKVPHRRRDVDRAVLQAVDAEVAVVSVGPNTYGHPSPRSSTGSARRVPRCSEPIGRGP